MSADEQNPRRAGYCNPPRAGQFQKGSSGNARGRPRKTKQAETGISSDYPTREAIRIEAKRRMPITDASGRHEIEARQALFRSMLARGMGPQGSVFAQRTALMMMLTEDERRYREQMERIESARRYIAFCRETNEELVAQGREPIAFLPNPDDYVIDWETLEVRIGGPIDEEGRAAAAVVCRYQDVCYEMAFYHDEFSHMIGENGQVTHFGLYFALYRQSQSFLWSSMRKSPEAYDKIIAEHAMWHRSEWESDLRSRCEALGLTFLPRKDGTTPLMIPLKKMGIRKPIQISPLCTVSRSRGRR